MARHTVAEAADILGITTGAVRNRLSRGTLQSVKDRGRVYVLLPDTPRDIPRDTRRDTGDTPLVEELRDRIRHLEEQVAQANERDRENRRIIAGLVQRVPELEAPPDTPPEPRESPVRATEQPGREEPQAPIEGPREPAERRPWWQRWFGG